MRTREELSTDGKRTDILILEVLLDIREYLSSIDAKTVAQSEREPVVPRAKKSTPRK